ncbi:hypothetical protein ACSNOK_22040 [Streptomyces sp. URMC 126]|uniref:hypothetical protein n=1 Tax=Streptomyces sp. URMC 126 TaxID=3423401 RepID=UPI003F1BB5E6
MLARTALVASVLVSAAHAATGAAQAGGLGGGLLSPAIGNGCANRAGATARGSAHVPGSAVGGNQVAAPGAVPTNQCGGADVPNPLSGVKVGQRGGDACVINQWFPGSNAASGQVLNEAVDAPVDVIVEVINRLTTAESGACG